MNIVKYVKDKDKTRRILAANNPISPDWLRNHTDKIKTIKE